VCVWVETRVSTTTIYFILHLTLTKNCLKYLNFLEVNYFHMSMILMDLIRISSLNVF
jgi:hypothetical protein